MTDVTSTVLMPILWSALEPCLAITLACVPLLRPLLGGRHPSTGTAKPGPGFAQSLITIGKKSSRKFSRLGNAEMNTMQLADEIPQLRPESVNYVASSRYSSTDENVDELEDLELGTISVRKDWKVERCLPTA